jgi:hypothetical protein
MENGNVSDEAKALSARGASKGGITRAQRLSPEERSEAARRAAQGRWGRQMEATHFGVLRVGDEVIECAVLEGGIRVINQGTLLRALGRNERPKSVDGSTVLFATNLQPFVSPALAENLAQPLRYTIPGRGRAVGYRAELLPQICEVYLDAKIENKILKAQEPAVRAAEVLIRGLARVGIIALVDAATGYEERRARDELQRILETYVVAEMRPWIKTFPDDFFRQIYRLQGWEYKPGTVKRTPYVGKLVNKYIYEQLPPGVLEGLEERNPRNERGNRTRRHHQFLSEDTGNRHLNMQISTVTTLMRMATDKQDFEELFERAFPPVQQRPPLVIDVPPALEEGEAAS